MTFWTFLTFWLFFFLCKKAAGYAKYEHHYVIQKKKQGDTETERCGHSLHWWHLSTGNAANAWTEHMLKVALYLSHDQMIGSQLISLLIFYKYQHKSNSVVGRCRKLSAGTFVYSPIEYKIRNLRKFFSIIIILVVKTDIELVRFRESVALFWKINVAVSFFILTAMPLCAAATLADSQPDRSNFLPSSHCDRWCRLLCQLVVTLYFYGMTENMIFDTMPAARSVTFIEMNNVHLRLLKMESTKFFLFFFSFWGFSFTSSIF